VSGALLQYAYLQILDLLSTLAFLVLGVQEANPIVRASLQLPPHPLVGLLTVKAAALLLGLYCFATNREGLLRRINCLFAAVVLWNLVALVVQSAAMRGSH